VSATSIVIAPDWVSVPDTVSELSASRVPPLIEILEASVPVSASFIDPAVTVIAPERVLPDAIETGVIWATERLLTVESLSTSSPPELLAVHVVQGQSSADQASSSSQGQGICSQADRCT
jgi:hypothetical protein